MASQAAIFASTISGMKKAVKRKGYDSDSDSSIEQLTNRGNKLRKKARFVREGQLAPPTGPVVYKKNIEYAGFHRDIISRNHPLVDEDGYEVDSDDDDERAEAAIAAAAELDPYSSIHIEQLLAPLTSAADLPNHPTLSKPFTSNTLTILTRQAGEMVQKEKASLWKIKHLLTRLSGDNTWIPCAVVESGNDFDLFIDERDQHRASLLPKVLRDDGDQNSTGTIVSDVPEPPVGLLTVDGQASDVEMEVAKLLIENVAVEQTNGAATINTAMDIEETAGGSPTNVTGTEEASNGIDKAPENGTGALSNGNDDAEMDGIPETTENQVQPIDEEDAVDDEAEVSVPRRMRTRAQAQAVSDNTTSRTRSATPDSVSESYIHPYFLASRASRSDRDLNLPPNEADETRRLLQLYIQKQEEVCRGAQKVYDGLLKADRYRHQVLKWCKAEAHVGLNRDMSDGEDWYDKEEWGLDEDLKKGQDEEEEDAATTAKKTRTRRQ